MCAGTSAAGDSLTILPVLSHVLNLRQRKVTCQMIGESNDSPFYSIIILPFVELNLIAPAAYND